MPLTLDAFQAAIRGKNDNGFVEFSSKDNRVNTYATGFFARTFGWYKSRSAETNREVRQQFFNMLSDSGRCQANVLAAIKDRLGLGSEGNGVQDRPLSIREVRTMMEWAERSAHVETFNAPASRKFAESLLADYNDIVAKRKDLPDNTKNAVLWEQMAMDAVRGGLGLTINGTQICASFDTKATTKDTIRQTVSDAVKSFNAQTHNDKVAAKIISYIPQQNVAAIFDAARGADVKTMQEDRPPFVNDIQSNHYNFNIQRQEDGSYDIDVRLTSNNLSEAHVIGGKENLEYFTGNTQFSYSAKLKLSFENNVPKIGFCDDGLPVIKGSREKCPFNFDEVSLLRSIMEKDLSPDSNTALPLMLNSAELMHNPELRTKVDELKTLQANKESHPNNQKLGDTIKQKKAELRSFILEHVVTLKDMNRLAAMGINNDLFRLLSTEWGGPKINHKLMTQLNSQDEMEVAKGLTTLQRMCKKAQALGFMSNEIILNPPNVALVDIGGFSAQSAGGFEDSDVGILADYCKRHPEERLLQDLSSLDQEKVASAKNRLNDILQPIRERQSAGITLLREQYNFSKDDVKSLRKRLGDEELERMMMHLYKQDAEVEKTLNEFHDILTMLAERRNAGPNLLEEHYGFAKGSIEQLHQKIGSEKFKGMMEHIYWMDAEMDDTLETMRQALEA